MAVEVNMLIVKVIARRIVNKEPNPLTGKIFSLDTITQSDYRAAVIKELKESYVWEVEE